MDYSIIIPAYNEQTELPATLEAVRRSQSHCPQKQGEIIVVDNASTDRTAQIAKDAQVRLVFETEHKIATVRNTGARAAQGKYLIFLDADTQMGQNLLTETFAALDSDRISGGGCAVLYRGDPPGFARRLVKIWAAVSRRTKWAAGSYLFCLRDAFEQVGGFDETLYYSEEVELSKALARWGCKHNMKFIILKTPVYTSARKFGWFSNSQIFWSLALAPFWRKNSKKSKIWYERPKKD